MATLTPLVSSARTSELETVTDRVVRGHGERVLVGVDGRSGSGKWTFADELARTLKRRGRTVVRSTTDLFHRPRVERTQMGATSPEGYYLHSHRIDVIVHELLEPFRAGATEVLVGAFDEPSDQPQPITAAVPTDSILVFDGLFVHRPEFRPLWNLTVMLHADRRSDEAWLRYLESDLPPDPIARAAELDRRLERARWPRYRRGRQRYAESIGEGAATIDIDNEQLATPTIVAHRAKAQAG